jgi:hypothetical protein
MLRKFLSVVLFAAILTSCSSKVETNQVSSPAETVKPSFQSLDSLYNEAKVYYESGDYNNLLSVGDKLHSAYPDDLKTKEVLTWTTELYKETSNEVDDALTSPSPDEVEPTKSPEEIKQALSGLRERKDEVRDISFFYAQSTSEFVDENDVYVYFSKSKDGVISNPRLKIQYAGDDWVFIDKYTINADGEIFEITPEYSEVVRDNNSNGVWEYYETYIDKDTIDMVRKIANAEKVIIRSSGESRHYDMTLSKQQKQAMQKVLKAYEDAGGLTIIFDIDL